MSNSSRVALVTGAGRGIGRAVAHRLLHEGFIVWCFDIDKEPLDDLMARLNAGLSAQLRIRPGDVSSEPDVIGLVEAIRAQDGRLDLVVNNAGIASPYNGPIENLDLSAWQRVIDVNLTGMFLIAKHSVALLRQSDHAAIVNMSSTRAFQSEPESESYAATKGGIYALTHALAISLGPAIRVNAIAPGWIDVRDHQADGNDEPKALRDIDHDQHPVGRVGRGADIAGLIVFLAGPDASFITGQTLVADGGMTRKMIYAH